MTTWFISDTHFGHANIIDYCNRPFANAGEMDEALITNWNELVAPDDRVYHLGDFAMSAKHAVAVRPKLNGNIRLLVGNHDDIPTLVRAGLFQRVQLWRKFPELNMVASHFPLHPTNLRGMTFNVHGHIHDQPERNDFALNISVEKTDYRPISMDDLGESLAALHQNTEKACTT